MLYQPKWSWATHLLILVLFFALLDGSSASVDESPYTANSKSKQYHYDSTLPEDIKAIEHDGAEWKDNRRAFQFVVFLWRETFSFCCMSDFTIDIALNSFVRSVLIMARFFAVSGLLRVYFPSRHSCCCLRGFLFLLFSLLVVRSLLPLLPPVPPQ